MSTDLNEKDRLLLALHYKVLSKLEPGHWDRHLEIVENGYEGRYWELTNWLSAPMQAHKTRFVESVLLMYEAFQDSIAKLPSAQREALPVLLKSFPGFDGNNESDALGYLRFLWSENRWLRLKQDNDGNSHFPIAGLYQTMLNAFEREVGTLPPARDFRDRPLNYDALLKIADAAGLREAA